MGTVREQGIPIFRTAVGSDYHGAMVIALVNKFIEIFNLRLGEFLNAKSSVVSDKQVGFEIMA